MVFVIVTAVGKLLLEALADEEAIVGVDGQVASIEEGVEVGTKKESVADFMTSPVREFSLDPKDQSKIFLKIQHFPCQWREGGSRLGLVLEGYSAPRLGEGGLDDLKCLGRIGVFSCSEAGEIDRSRRSKLGRLTGRHAVAAAEMLKRRLRLQQGEEDPSKRRGMDQEEG